MPHRNDPKAPAGDPLDAVIADYVQQVEAGQVPDRQALLAQRPDPAERLRPFFADYDRLDRQAAELLKMPTCFGGARQVVLKHLGNRYGRRFANHWEFVRFAREHHLELDLTSPPKRPARPATSR